MKKRRQGDGGRRRKVTETDGLNGAGNLCVCREYQIYFAASHIRVEEHLDSSHLSSVRGDNNGLISNGEITVPGETQLICDGRITAEDDFLNAPLNGSS